MSIYIDTKALRFANQNFLVEVCSSVSLYTNLSAMNFIIFNILQIPIFSQKQALNGLTSFFIVITFQIVDLSLMSIFIDSEALSFANQHLWPNLWLFQKTLI